MTFLSDFCTAFGNLVHKAPASSLARLMASMSGVAASIMR